MTENFLLMALFSSTKNRKINPAKKLSGSVAVPGDKSISHRYAMLAAIAEGASEIKYFSSSADCQSTLACLKKLGVKIDRKDDTVIIRGGGLGGLRAPTGTLDAGNSGSTMRMLSGILAGQSFLSVIGGDASKRLRQAALATCGFEEETSYNAELLADIREVFTENGSERISSADLVAARIAMTDRPWGECSHGKPLTQNQLARRLKAFELRPRIMRVNGIPAKGYERDDFSDAFSRYSPDSGFHPVTPLQSNDFTNLRKNQTVTRKSGVTVSKSTNSNDFTNVTGVTDENPQTGDSRTRG